MESTTKILDELESAAAALEPSECQRAEMFAHVERWAAQFLHNTHSGKAYVVSEDKGSAIRAKAVREHGYSLHEVFALVEQALDNKGLNPASAGHLAYVPGGGIVTSAFADFIAAVSNRYAGVFYAGPGAVRVENRMVRWMADMLDMGESAGGTLTSGGSIANLTAIICARDAILQHSSAYSSAIIYMTTQVHHCVNKALRAAGLGDCDIRYVDVDSDCRMDMAHLRDLVSQDTKNYEAAPEQHGKPFMIIGSAGTTNTGAVDPLIEMAAIAKDAQCWFHIDAAYGGFFMLTEYGKQAMRGIQLADSVVLDPHKGLFLPYGIGAVIVKNIELLKRSQHYSADYLQDVIEDPMEVSPADVSLELTRHFRGLRMWLPLMLHGVAPFRAALEEKLLLARYFREELVKRASVFEIGPGSDLSIVTYRMNPSAKALTSTQLNTMNERLQQLVAEDGRVFLSGTVIGETYWMRIAILSFRTHRTTIDTTLEILDQLSSELISNTER